MELATPNARELRRQTVRVRRLIGRVGEEIEMPRLRVESAIAAGAVELAEAKSEPAVDAEAKPAASDPKSSPQAGAQRRR